MSAKKRGLGKGLSALIPDEPILNADIKDSKEDNVKLVDISLIEPNSEQPRKDFDEEALRELTLSIQKHGILQPIILRKKDKGYEIVAGERRWRAAKDAGLKEIPALIKEYDQIEISQIALIENLQREDLNPIEEAMAYKNLCEKYNLTHEEISQSVGKSRSYISNAMRLLNLEDEIIQLIVEGKITSGHGRALLALEDSSIRKKLCQTILEKNLSVRETEEIVKSYLNRDDKKKKSGDSKKADKKDPIILGIEESLRKFFGTKVTISKGSKKGKIEIEYYSDDDLERILELISK